MNEKILCVAGPTASGKTALGVELALALNGEVVSADSMQIYRHMSIGTAKPDKKEQKGIPHHMLDIVEPWDDYSVARYVEDADRCVQDILQKEKLPIIVGGTGLYVDSLIRGQDFLPNSPEKGYRKKLTELAETEGIESVIRILEEFDPDSARRLHPNDEKRIIRAAEVYLETGKTITRHNLESKARPPRYRAVIIGLNYENRQTLYDRIDLRFDLMMEAGLTQEVEDLLKMGVPRGCTAMQAIGYKEIIRALDGRNSMEEAAETIKQESRRYAKRQLTWFRRNPDIHWIIQSDPISFDETLIMAKKYADWLK